MPQGGGRPIPPGGTPGSTAGGTPAATASIDRVIFWSVLALIVSLIGLGAIAVYAVKTDQLATCLNAAGIVYSIISTLFLGVIAMVFVKGHLGSSRDIEAPKMELFELEKRR